MTTSSENLLKLARESQDAGNIDQAIKYLEEALRTETDPKLLFELSKLYEGQGNYWLAYSAIKHMPNYLDSQYQDYFFKLLAKNNFLIEALQIEANTDLKICQKYQIVAVDDRTQSQIMKKLRQKNITEEAYAQVLKLSLTNFKNFVRATLVDPTAEFALRISLIEECSKLRLDEQFSVLVDGQPTTFVPKETIHFLQEPLYLETLAEVNKLLVKDPSYKALAIASTNIILGALYPKLGDYVTDPKAFAKDIVGSVMHTGAGEHEELFQRLLNQYL